jgi:hypothetical protein
MEISVRCPTTTGFGFAVTAVMRRDPGDESTLRSTGELVADLPCWSVIVTEIW